MHLLDANVNFACSGIMLGKACACEEVKLLDRQVVLERISKLPQATIAKTEGFARGSGASCMARQTGLDHALEIVLGARDFDANQAEFYSTVNHALDEDEIGPFVEGLARRIALWPSESINASKQAVYESIALPIQEALRAEAYWLYQATSLASALKHFKWANEQGAWFDMDNQHI